MWSLVVFVYITTVVVYAQKQNSRRPESHDNGHGWDIRLAVPGEPGGDYPTLNAIPRTSFSCSRKSPGYYADVETGCQVFRVCTLGSTYGFQSFLCPNGTLFNQEVFVCDWWMNVNCERSQKLFDDNRDKFGNLKLGPQLMKDIKKMLTHPMRNPYDKSLMKSNLVIMQEYKAPSGQLFPNGALISGPDRPPSNIYIPAKQRQGNFAQNSFISGDLSYAASTPSSQYIPSSFNAVESSRDILQQQMQNIQSIQNSNSHTGQIRAKNSELIDNNKISQSTYTQNQNQYQRNIHNFQTTPQNIPNGQLQRRLSQYNSNLHQLNQIKQPDLKGSVPTQQYSYGSKQNGQINNKNYIPQLSKESNGNVIRESQQKNFNANIVQPTGKTLKFSRIVQKSSSGNPKSRITFKTWIVRPSKTARLVAEPTPYTYDIPTNSPIENRLVDTTVYDKNPTTEKFNLDAEDVPYVYNRPTPSSKQENVPYIYNRPTPSSKQVITVDESPLIYLPPTAPTLSNRLYSTLKPQPSTQSNLNVPPTTYKPASRFYVPPSVNSLELSRQYLNPNVQLPDTTNYQSARLVVTPTSPTFHLTTVISNNNKSPSFSLTKQSHINTNHNNLTFADILTKEKLDITVNDIVKNTNEILKTASPDVLNQYRENYASPHKSANNYLSPEFDNDLEDKHTLQPSQTLQKSEKLIATPSTELEPPIDMSNKNYINSNKLSNLPFFKEPAIPTNTIERTVSLKITIPETIADYLFKNHTQTNSDDLEILNTGSSNYLVLTNGHLDENNGAELIPIGKLIWDKNINVSNSQALVYSFLADSINAAKEYSILAKQNIAPSTITQLQARNINNEDIGDISNKISQLTSSQFTQNNQNRQYMQNSKVDSEHSQPQSSQFPTLNPPNQLYSSRLQRLSSNNLIENLERNAEQIYSGQLYKLPVPIVTSKIYNSPNTFQTSQVKQEKILTNEYSDANEINNNKNSNRDVEIISSESLPYAPARQELPRTEEASKRFFNIQDNYENIFADNFLNTDTAITAQVQDKITGSLPHPLEENKLVTYQNNKSYYLYTKLDDDSSDNVQTTNSITQTNEQDNLQNAKLMRSNDLSNRITFELFPSIGYDLEDKGEKQQILEAFKNSDFSNPKRNSKTDRFNQRQDTLVTGVDFTIIHPSSKKQTEQNNNVNTILYRGPSSYLAPQSSVGSLEGSQQKRSNARIEQFNDNNGYSKTIPTRQFSF